MKKKERQTERYVLARTSVIPQRLRPAVGQFRTYSTPSAQQLLHHLILLWAQQRAPAALHFTFGPSTHGCLRSEFIVWKAALSRPTLPQHWGSQSRKFLFSVFSTHHFEAGSGDRTSLTPTFLLSLRGRATTNVLLPFSDNGSAFCSNSAPAHGTSLFTQRLKKKKNQINKQKHPGVFKYNILLTTFNLI